MSTLRENAERIESAANDIREVIDLCYGGVSEDEHIEDYAEKLARGAVDEATEQRFLSRTTADGANIKDGIAYVESIKGETLKVVQLVNNPFFMNGTRNWLTMTTRSIVSVTDNILSLYIPTNEAIAGQIRWGNIRIWQTPFNWIESHKYLACTRVLAPKAIRINVYYTISNGIYSTVKAIPNVWTLISAIGVAKDSGSILNLCGADIDPSFEETYKFKFILMFDLTAMGWEDITTADQFTQRMFNKNADDVTDEEWASISEYTEGSLFSMTGKEIVSRGRNIWDEEWENGTINVNTGLNNNGRDDLLRIRTKNYIRVKPNTRYYRNKGFYWFVWFDKDKNYISYSANNLPSPPNAMYMRTFTESGYGSSVYNNDIMISESNAPYEPYYADRFSIDPTAILDSDGNQVFPNGLIGIGDVKDEIDYVNNVAIKRIDRLEFKGTEYWYFQSSNNRFYLQSVLYPDVHVDQIRRVVISNFYKSGVKNDLNTSDKMIYTDKDNQWALGIKDTSFATTADWKAHLVQLYSEGNPLIVYYIKNEPIVYPLPKRKNYYRVSNGGTEEIVADGATTPLTANIAYRMADSAAMAMDLTNAQNLL